MPKPKEPTPKALWEEASKKHKPQIRDRDYMIIVVSSAVSAGVSFFVSKADWTKVSLTKIFLIDFVLGLIGLSAIILGIILFLFCALRFLTVFGEFCSLVWNRFKIRK